MKGHLLVIDGIDGCGKTTQINHLAHWLPISGLMPEGSKLHITREPGGTELGNSLRQMLLNPSTTNGPEPITELLLYAADRAQHISQLISPALNQGDWVLSDRFSGSTIAYQGYGRNLDIDLIKQLEDIATQGIAPEITLWLDIEVQESLRRRQKKSKDRIEAEGKDFLSRVSSCFSHLSETRHWTKISAENNPKNISEKVENEIKNYFNNLESNG